MKQNFFIVSAFALLLMGASCTTAKPVSNTTNTTNQQSVAQHTKVLMKTSMGDIKIELFDDKAPNTVKNFLDLSAKNFYDGILFHRVITGFMIQAGDPQTKTDPKNWAIHGTGGPGYEFANEDNDEKLVSGSVAMANAGRDTNGSQFFIVTAPALPNLDGSYTNFGKVLEGMDVVEAISKVKRNENDHPLEDVKILSITVVQ